MQKLENWVFPTPVGMNRPTAISTRPTARVPHARGDEPIAATFIALH